MCQKMSWVRLLSPKRFRYSHGNTNNIERESGDNENGRSEFQKDLDRITFSSSFRRLGRKTQVHLLSENDQIHTRLSHSLEVACVGRSLGTKVGHWLRTKEGGSLPDGFQHSTVGEIVQAACLAHDIGNPPFGHAAEDAVREWFKEKLGSDPDWKARLTEGEIGDLKYWVSEGICG